MDRRRGRPRRPIGRRAGRQRGWRNCARRPVAVWRLRRSFAAYVAGAARANVRMRTPLALRFPFRDFPSVFAHLIADATGSDEGGGTAFALGHEAGVPFGSLLLSVLALFAGSFRAGIRARAIDAGRPVRILLRAVRARVAAPAEASLSFCAGFTHRLLFACSPPIVCAGFAAALAGLVLVGSYGARNTCRQVYVSQCRSLRVCSRRTRLAFRGACFGRMFRLVVRRTHSAPGLSADRLIPPRGTRLAYCISQTGLHPSRWAVFAARRGKHVLELSNIARHAPAPNTIGLICSLFTCDT